MPNNYLNQCWLIVYCNIANTFSEITIEYNSLKENGFEYVCKMTAILYPPHWVRWLFKIPQHSSCATSATYTYITYMCFDFAFYTILVFLYPSRLFFYAHTTGIALKVIESWHMYDTCVCTRTSLKELAGAYTTCVLTQPHHLLFIQYVDAVLFSNTSNNN